MFGRVSATVALASVSILAGCSAGQSVSQTTSSLVPPASGASAVRPNKDCAGTHGVKVTPCPITLTRRNKGGVVVTVSGPGVNASYLEELNACFSHKICYNAQRQGSSAVQWRISPGLVCGAADIQFDAYAGASQLVGDAFLKSTNEYCPRR